MADMYVRLNTARSYTYNVARAMDNGLFPSKVLSVPRGLHCGGHACCTRLLDFCLQGLSKRWGRIVVTFFAVSGLQTGNVQLQFVTI